MPRVKIFHKPIDNGQKFSVYLEYSPPIVGGNGKRVRYECLNLELFANPETDAQIKENTMVEEIAESIRCQRFLQHVRHDYKFLAKAQLDEDFIEYFRLNGDCHGDKYISSRLHFEKFCNGTCKFRDINASFCTRFRLYLLREKGLYHKSKKLSRNTASSYFNAFLSVVHLAFQDNILSEDYSSMVEKISWEHDIKKEYLLTSEIKQLASTPYEELPELYTAGMFSVYTGLRRSDILALRWENIRYEKGRKAFMRLRIRKTETQVQLPLSLQAVRVLGAHKKKGKIFPHLTEYEIHKHLPRWISKAKINKHITFHCFRHTFAMQLLSKGIDIYTISALLGHRQVASTQNYAKITPEKVMEAIQKLDR